MVAVAKANELCNKYGLDTISCGATIAFAMECYEKGLISKEKADGLELNLGNKDVLAILVEKIAKREGIGELLSQGSKRAAQMIGEAAIPLSIDAKGQEFPAHMPHNKPMIGLQYAIYPGGADHTNGEVDETYTMPADSFVMERLSDIGAGGYHEDIFNLTGEKVKLAFTTHCYSSLADTLCMCLFIYGSSAAIYGPKEVVELCKSGIGWDVTINELIEIGERKLNMMRYLSSREGFTKKDDVLPDRIFEPLKDGPSKGKCLNREQFESAKETYYNLVGWDSETGNPTKETLNKLSLGWVLDI